jgi:hypothetical protein
LSFYRSERASAKADLCHVLQLLQQLSLGHGEGKVAAAITRCNNVRSYIREARERYCESKRAASCFPPRLLLSHRLGGRRAVLPSVGHWQLVINTTSSIVTFLMVFVIQNTQVRDNAALNAKLDNILKVMEGTDKRLIGVENLTDREIEDIRSPPLGR